MRLLLRHGSPGVLKTLSIKRTRCEDYADLGGFPATQSDPILRSIIVLYLSDTLLPWTSTAYHSLVDLRLQFTENDKREISTSQLAGILAASPGLTTLKFDYLTITSSDDWDAENVVRLAHLEVLCLWFLSYRSWVALVSVLSLSDCLGSLEVGIRAQDSVSHFSKISHLVQDFLHGVRVKTLAIIGFEDDDPQYALSLSATIPSLESLVLSDCNLLKPRGDEVAGYEPRINVDTPSRLPHLFLASSRFSLDNLKRIISVSGVETLHLDRVPTRCGHNGPTKDELRAALLDAFPRLTCVITDKDTTLKWPCRSFNCAGGVRTWDMQCLVRIPRFPEPAPQDNRLTSPRPEDYGSTLPVEPATEVEVSGRSEEVVSSSETRKPANPIAFALNIAALGGTHPAAISRGTCPTEPIKAKRQPKRRNPGKEAPPLPQILLEHECTEPEAPRPQKQARRSTRSTVEFQTTEHIVGNASESAGSISKGDQQKRQITTNEDHFTTRDSVRERYATAYESIFWLPDGVRSDSCALRPPGEPALDEVFDPYAHYPPHPYAHARYSQQAPPPPAPIYGPSSKEGSIGHGLKELGQPLVYSVQQEVVDAVTEQERKRQEAINEVIDTERDFVRDLEYLRDVSCLFALSINITRLIISKSWMTPLRTDNVIPLERRTDFVQQVFWNVEDIIDVNTRLRDLLIKRQKAHAIVETIGDIFLELVPHFGPFVLYGKHQLYGKYEFEKEKASNPAFSSFVETVERLPASRKLELNGYLTKPTTRLARYPLLLEVVLKHTPEDNPDQVAIPKAVKIVRELLGKVNEERRKAENRFDLSRLDERLVFRPGEEMDLKLKDEQRQTTVLTFPLNPPESTDSKLSRKRTKRISSHASHFRAGHCLGRTLVCAVDVSPSRSTIKVFEQIDQAAREKNKPMFKKLLQGGNDLLKVFKYFYISTESHSVQFFKTKLCIACTKGFEVVDPDTLDTQSLLDPSDTSLDFVHGREDVCLLSLYQIGQDFLLCYTEFAFYVGTIGRRCKQDLTIYWEGIPTAFALQHPYVMAFDPAFIEIWYVENGTLAQVIRGNNLRCLFHRL
ncbi:RHO1 GDP-GTP exchange protein 2 [Ceratobasidium sp. 428]|nr:RHO1 GDP-GTP exchange protein 2 [Ceratobasidium sp. 428]